ncbi:MAG: dihydroneopterin aldolase [Saprospiraceae bacterium]|nr:dihydroneopterin aldolase [Saprospiraceae bacterium]
MATIALEGARFYAYHGFYEEEQILGCEYIVDVFVEADVDAAAEEDDLFATVNYETLYLICQVEMRKPSQLIETVGQRIMTRISDMFPNIFGAKLCIRKMNPPLGGRVGSSSITFANGVFDLFQEG